jgi:sensor histidine kinase YesM
MSSERIDVVLIIAVFSILSIIGALILIFTVFMRKRNTLVKEKYEVQIAANNKHHALELQALRSQMNPHFVHNSLNAIQYYIQRNEVELSEIYLTKFSKLIRSFFKFSRKQNITIGQEIDLLENYLAIEQLRFEDKLSYSISKDRAIDDEELIPTMLLQPIVENAINHGIFHKEGPGRIEVHFEYLQEGSYKVVIKDDGIGLEKSKALFKKSGKKLNDRSSAVLHDRLTLLEYSKTWKVDYTLEDRTDVQGAIAILQFKPIIDESTSLSDR